MSKILMLAMAATLMVACASTPAVNGAWEVAVTAPEGATYFTMSVAVDGEEASGMVGEEPFSGTYTDGELKLSGDYYVPEAGYSAELNMDIRLEDDQLTGTATWDQFSADVSATRVE